MSAKIKSRVGRIIDEIEETLIALILAAMTLLTFANFIARDIFNSNILWAVEATVFLFAWLVLLGASYGVKKSIHIGVDVVTKSVPPLYRRIMLLCAVTACLAYSALLLKGSWDYWYPYITNRSWLETEDVPMPEVLQFLAALINDGERWEKMPVFIPYLILPLSMGLLLFRYIQVAIQVIKGENSSLIASHEAEEINLDNSPAGEGKN